MDRVERQLDATRKLVQAGMKMLVDLKKETYEFKKEVREFKKETRYAIHALIEAQNRADARQERTEAKFNQLIELLTRNNSNGHKH